MALIVLVSPRAFADPPARVRADAFGSSASPMGLFVLSGEVREQRWIDAEALVWGGIRSQPADVLVASVRLRDPKGRGEVRLGRQIVTAGAVRPAHMDGLMARGRLSWGGGLTLFGGVPVSRGFGARLYDWIAGGRVSWAAADRLVAGVSYVQRREQGAVAIEEAGADLSVSAARWLDLALRGTYDLVRPGVADAHATVATRGGPLRIELFGIHRSPGRLVAATSIFSALGDMPTEQAGLVVTWFAAPRLDLLASGAGRLVGGTPGIDGSVRATLRLDDRGRGMTSIEARRASLPYGALSAVRLAGRVPLAGDLSIAGEFELVVPDDSQGRGALWPWGLLALSWRADRWEAAAAVQAGASPSTLFDLNVLARLAYRWEAP